MTDTENDRPDDDDAVPGDELREHAQDPAEGPDEEDEARPDVPRVHAEDPSEG